MKRGTFRKKAFGWIFLTLLFLLSVPSSLKIIYPLRHGEVIARWAATYRLDPHLVAAVIRSESRFRTNAISHAGAIGLMQITPPTGQWIAEQLNVTGFTEDTLFDPELNVQFGTWYLRHLLDQFNNNVEAALIAYNAGPSNLRRWWSGEGTIFPETAAYVAKVQRAWSRYRLFYELPILGDLLKIFPV